MVEIGFNGTREAYVLVGWALFRRLWDPLTLKPSKAPASPWGLNQARRP